MEPPRVPCHSLIRSDAIIRKNKRSNDLETADLPVQYRDKMHKIDPTAESPPDSGGGEVNPLGNCERNGSYDNRSTNDIPSHHGRSSEAYEAIITAVENNKSQLISLREAHEADIQDHRDCIEKLKDYIKQLESRVKPGSDQHPSLEVEGAMMPSDPPVFSVVEAPLRVKDNAIQAMKQQRDEALQQKQEAERTLDEERVRFQKEAKDAYNKAEAKLHKSQCTITRQDILHQWQALVNEIENLVSRQFSGRPFYVPITSQQQHLFGMFVQNYEQQLRDGRLKPLLLKGIELKLDSSRRARQFQSFRAHVGQFLRDISPEDYTSDTISQDLQSQMGKTFIRYATTDNEEELRGSFRGVVNQTRALASLLSHCNDQYVVCLPMVHELKELPRGFPMLNKPGSKTKYYGLTYRETYMEELRNAQRINRDKISQSVSPALIRYSAKSENYKEGEVIVKAKVCR
ncbi:hypothetical protein E8E14_004023 [Neopestalotiopsis sp. 37M]|nr:hypothetical protein E8E14_004023 [Neopestalotiopsis sp. 37M]